MSDLPLDSLEIKNFRCFEHLVIEKLGRVNLIVGRNSVGKTCLLEALMVYATKAEPSTIYQALKNRDETMEDLQPNGSKYPDTIEESIRHLFYGREISIGETFATIGSINPITQIEFGPNFYTDEADESGRIKSLRVLEPSEYELADNIQLRLSVKYGDERQIPRPLKMRSLPFRLIMQKSSDINYVFIPTSGLNNNRMADLWDNIALTELEQDTNLALKIIDTDCEKYTFLKEPPHRYPVVKHKSHPKPIPLRSLGEGMGRSLAIALGLVNSTEGLLLIDEFESGLHHRIQADLWRMVFRLAKSLKVQVFATTHSWDCVEAFQKAAAEDQNEEAMLIRLTRRKNGQIKAVLYSEEEQAIVTEQNIEVR